MKVHYRPCNEDTDILKTAKKLSKFSVKNLARLKLIRDDKSVDKKIDKKCLYFQANNGFLKAIRKLYRFCRSYSVW